MLQYLTIKNLALIDAAELEFEAGFTTVTGETGAGKSVLLGALALLAGHKAAKTLIRQGAEATEVEGTLHFADPAAVDAALAALDLPCSDDGTVILRRTLSVRKAGRCQINGVTVPQAMLAAFGEHWIDLHGPSEPQRLFQERVQLELLDLFAEHTEAVETYRRAFGQWRATLAEIDAIRNAEPIGDDEAAFLQGQLDSIDAVNLDPEAIDSLERDFNRLDKTRDIAEAADAIIGGLRGDKALAGIASRLLRQARALSHDEPEAAPLADRIEALVIEADDLAGEFQALADAVNFNPAEVEAIQRRMQVWLDVRRRFGPTPEDVRAKREHLARRLGGRADAEARLADLADKAAKQETGLREQARALTATRKKAASTLAGRVSELLKRLGFKAPRLEIDVTATKTLTECGDSTCRFLFAANRGTDLRPLNAIASSGETARVMLALKTVLAEIDATAVLVFDEVDANIGGETGVEVGRELARLGDRHQVLCVTHLPQVAACGRQHWEVAKLETGDATVVRFRPLERDGDARIEELARMLGDRRAKSAKEHARALLNGVTA